MNDTIEWCFKHQSLPLPHNGLCPYGSKEGCDVQLGYVYKEERDAPESYDPFWAAEIPEACACAACEAPYDDE